MFLRISGFFKDDSEDDTNSSLSQSMKPLCLRFLDGEAWNTARMGNGCSPASKLNG